MKTLEFSSLGLQEVSLRESLLVNGGGCPWYCEHWIMEAAVSAYESFAKGFKSGFDSFTLQH